MWHKWCKGVLAKNHRTLSVGRRGFERLEPRLTMSASSIDGRPYIDVGPSDNVAWDQPRVTVQLLTEDVPDDQDPPQSVIVGPNVFNNWLLDTGANTTLAFQTAITDMREFEPRYQTDGVYAEIGVGGTSLFDISAPYRFDFSGNTTFERNKLLDSRIISNPNSDVSIFGPWGITGMPAMADRVTTLDFTPWTNVSDTDLFMKTDFLSTLPEPAGVRYAFNVDNRVSFAVEDGFVSGSGLPMWGDVPFLTAQLKNNESVTGGNFLFDTGAQVSIISSQIAFHLGLDSNGDGELSSLDANFARMETIGGISGVIDVPVFLIDEVHVPTAQGPDLVWTDLQWLVLDIADGIEGVFGFDNMTSGWIEAFGIDGQSGFIMKSQLDFRQWSDTGQGQVNVDLNPEQFTLVDPNGPGATVQESGGSTVVSENGYTDSYTIQLTQAPAANVTVTFVGSNGQVTAFDDANPSNNFVTFTPSNWNVPRTVRVSGVNDSQQESYHRAYIRNLSTSADPAFSNVGMPRVSVGVIDDDFPGVMILPTDGATHVSESGGNDFYDVVLTTPPAGPVSIKIEHVAQQLTAVSQADSTDTLNFTSANWNVPQRVRVTAIDDALGEGSHIAYITHLVETTDLEYSQAFALQEKVFIGDNEDVAGPQVIDVIVGSQAWSGAFIDVVDGNGTSSAGIGYSLVGTSQLDNLPWSNIDRIHIAFSENVSAAFNANNLRLIGTNTANYLTGAVFVFGEYGSNIGTIKLAAPISNDSLVLSVLDSLTDAVGNRLDGEWSTSQENSSGNGINGGSLIFSLEILAGDANNSNAVNLGDLIDIYRLNLSTVTTLSQAKMDVNGNGGVNLGDLTDAYRYNFNVLPAQPSPPPSTVVPQQRVQPTSSPSVGSGWLIGQAMEERFNLHSLMADGSPAELADSTRAVPGSYLAKLLLDRLLHRDAVDIVLFEDGLANAGAAGVTVGMTSTSDLADIASPPPLPLFGRLFGENLLPESSHLSVVSSAPATEQMVQPNIGTELIIVESMLRDIRSSVTGTQADDGLKALQQKLPSVRERGLPRSLGRFL